MKDWKEVLWDKESWVNKIYVVNGKNYLVCKDEISIGDLVTNGWNITRFDDTFSLLGFYKVVASEDKLGFVMVETKNRLFENEEPEIDHIPLNKRWFDAILSRGGVCDVIGVLNKKLVLNF
jgi:hypothetical protein